MLRCTIYPVRFSLAGVNRRDQVNRHGGILCFTAVYFKICCVKFGLSMVREPGGDVDCVREAGAGRALPCALHISRTHKLRINKHFGSVPVHAVCSYDDTSRHDIYRTKDFNC